MFRSDNGGVSWLLADWHGADAIQDALQDVRPEVPPCPVCGTDGDCGCPIPDEAD